MDTTAALWSIDEQNVTSSLERAATSLDSECQQVDLDFSSVRRLDSKGLRALQEFSCRAHEKRVAVALRGVNVDIYKTVKLARLAKSFSFVN